MTDEVLDEVKTWQNRRLDAVYPIIYFWAQKSVVQNDVTAIIPGFGKRKISTVALFALLLARSGLIV